MTRSTLRRDAGRAVAVVLVALAAAVLAALAAPPALSEGAVDPEQHPNLFTVGQVLVNKGGAITISGQLDCADAMAAWGLADELAGGSISWTARQPVGRKGVVVAHYESAIAAMCHEPDDVAPYAWFTHPPFTSPAIWWVTPDSGGKFTAGPIHVEARFLGAPWTDAPEAADFMITGATQWDGKAARK